MHDGTTIGIISLHIWILRRPKGPPQFAKPNTWVRLQSSKTTSVFSRVRLGDIYRRMMKDTDNDHIFCNLRHPKSALLLASITSPRQHREPKQYQPANRQRQLDSQCNWALKVDALSEGRRR